MAPLATAWCLPFCFFVSFVDFVREDSVWSRPLRVDNEEHVTSDPCIELLSDLVAIDSVNPSLVSGGAGESRIAGFIADHLAALGCGVHVQEAAPGRPNVIGVLDSGAPGPSLMFCGHVDTVGVDGMQSPFEPAIREGRLYGRGAQDMKGGVAAMIDAARLARERGFRRGRLIIAAVVDEEYASIGADALVREWTADAAVVTEPTDLQIGVGHKGFAWFEIETLGRAAHGSRPREGRDAVFRMGRVLNGLERLDRDLQARSTHPIMGTASLHASIIAGGREWSSYPDRCVLQVERRTIAGETSASAEMEMLEILEALRAADAEFEAALKPIFSRPPYETPSGHRIIQTLRRCADKCSVAAEPVGMSFWTDAAILGGTGVPSVLFGPGGAGLHSTEEYVNTADVIACRDVLAELAMTWSSGP
jgi:acetylornithine deacetylase